MGFDYEIQYKSGSEKKMADALSSVHGFEILLMALYVLHSDVHEKIQRSYDKDINYL